MDVVTKSIGIVTVLATLSVASERLVEIIKAYIPYLNAEVAGDPSSGSSVILMKEARRKAAISLLSVFCGIFTAFLSSPILAGIFSELSAGSTCGLSGFGESAPCTFNLTGNGLLVTISLGLLAAGGSSLWNSVLEYLLKIKELKKSQLMRSEELRRIDVKMAEIELARALSRPSE